MYGRAGRGRHRATEKLERRGGGGQRRKARGGRQKTKKQEKEGRVYVRNSRKERA